MNFIVMLLLVGVAAVLQDGLPGFTILAQAKFPFLPAVVLYYALCRGIGSMLLAAFIAGVVQDAVSPVPLGFSVCCFMLVGWIASRFQRLVMTESVVTPMFFGAVVGGTTTLVLFAMLTGHGLIACSLPWALAKAAATGLLGVAATPPVFLAAGSFDRLVGNVSSRRDVHDVG